VYIFVKSAPIYVRPRPLWSPAHSEQIHVHFACENRSLCEIISSVICNYPWGP